MQFLGVVNHLQCAVSEMIELKNDIVYDGETQQKRRRNGERYDEIAQVITDCYLTVCDVLSKGCQVPHLGYVIQRIATQQKRSEELHSLHPNHNTSDREPSEWIEFSYFKTENNLDRKDALKHTQGTKNPNIGKVLPSAFCVL